MVRDTCASGLLGIDGLSVTEVEDTSDGVRMVYAVTSGEVMPVCPSCRTPSANPKCYVTTHFIETVPQVPAGARVTCRLRAAAGAAVCDGGRTVEQSARDHDLSWPVVQAEFETAAAAVLPKTPPATPMLGIDEIRRGKARFVTDQDTGKIRQMVDRWFTGFVDLTGAHGLLGRAADDVGAWLAEQTPAWRDAVRVVAIDICASYRKAIREHLPHAAIVVDHFHLVQLANAKLARVRRRVTATVRGRRARKDDPEFGIRRRLQRNLEDLREGQMDDMFARLESLGVLSDHVKIA